MKQLLKKRSRENHSPIQIKAFPHKKKEMPNFLLKLYQILENNDNKGTVSWGDSGKSFIVKNLNEFSDRILPKYFKHNNFSSFVRQLNMYDFHKKRNTNVNDHVFLHKNFVRGQRSLIKTIKRKNKNRERLEHNGCISRANGLKNYCQNILRKKKSRHRTEKVFSCLMKTLNETNSKQSLLENKVEELSRQNDEFILENQKLLEEIMGKDDYTKKLESLIYFIIDFVIPKHQGMNNFNHTNFMNTINKPKPDFLSKLGGLRSSFTKANIDNTSENSSENFFEKYTKFNKDNKFESLQFPMFISRENSGQFNLDKSFNLSPNLSFFKENGNNI